MLLALIGMNTLILSKKLFPLFLGFIFIAGPSHEAVEAPIEKLEYIEEIALQPNRVEAVFKRKLVTKRNNKPNDLLESSLLEPNGFGALISKSLPLYRLYCSSIIYD